MTSIAGTPAIMPFNKSIFSSPEMRPHLEKYYEQGYAVMRERIAAMKEAETNGQAPKTLQITGGGTATELSAAQYEAVIPSFDKWLEMQERFSSFDMAGQSTSTVEHARERLSHMETALNPDQPSDVRTVFSNGNQILAYINKDGGLVTHEGAHFLQKIAKQADKLDLTGEARIAYLKERGEAELSRHYAHGEVTEYNSATMPTKREFAEKWYPHHDVDAAYEDSLQEARAHLEQMEAWHKQQTQNLYDMRAFLLQSMEEAQNGQEKSSGVSTEAA